MKQGSKLQNVPEPSFIFFVSAAKYESGVTASYPYASAVQIQDIPNSSNSLIKFFSLEICGPK